MDDLIREIIEAFESARVDFGESEPGMFLSCLYANRIRKISSSWEILVTRFTPILKKYIEPDRIEKIDSLLEKLQSEYPDAHIRLSGKGKGAIWNGPESFLSPFGPDYQFSTPEEALRSLLPDESTAPLPSEQLAAGQSVEGIVEIDGKRFKVTLVPEGDWTCC